MANYGQSRYQPAARPASPAPAAAAKVEPPQVPEPAAEPQAEQQSYRDQRIAELRAKRAAAPARQHADLNLWIPEHLKRKDLHYHWLNDDDRPGNVQAMTESGYYDFVYDDEVLEDKGGGRGVRQHDASARIKRRVGTNLDGSPKFAYLCCKPIEMYKEDVARQNAASNELVQMIHRVKATGDVSQMRTHGGGGIEDDAGHTYVATEGRLPPAMRE